MSELSGISIMLSLEITSVIFITFLCKFWIYYNFHFVKPQLKSKNQTNQTKYGNNKKFDSINVVIQNLLLKYVYFHFF